MSIRQYIMYIHSDIHSHIWTFWHTFPHIHSHIWIFWHTYILTYKYYDIRRAKWIFIHIILHSDHRTRDPKGHISCIWLQCATFINRSDRTAILFFRSARSQSYNMIYENIKYFQKFMKKCLKKKLCFYPKIKVIFLIKVKRMLYMDVLAHMILCHT